MADNAKVWMHSVKLTDKTAAAELYMPFVKGGGLFVETDQPLALGDSLFILLTVGDQGTKFPINGKVVWINGESVRGDRPVGVGLQFPSDSSGEAAKTAIEELIGTIRGSLKKTATL